MHIRRNHQIELAIPVIIYKRATRSPLRTCARNSRRPRYFLKCPVSLVVIEAVLAISSYVDIFKPIVVIIT